MLTKQEPMSWSLLQNNEKSISIHAFTWDRPKSELRPA